MNKEYIYSDGNVIIRDYDDNQKRTLYYDHLDDVLILENLIEVTEEKINLLENKKKSVEEKNERLKKNILMPFIMLTAVSTIIYIFVIYILFPNYPQGMYTLEELKSLFLKVEAISSLIGIFCSSELYFKDYKPGIKQENGLNNSLNEMKLTLDSMKKQVKELQKCKTTHFAPKDLKIVAVDDKKMIESYQDNFDFYYNCGYHEEKFRKYYELGILFQKLEGKYSELEIEQIAEYLENKEVKEQENKLIKKRVITKKQK